MTKYVKNKVIEIIDHDEYDVPDTVTQTETIIYDWVAKKYGNNEAENPSWNISDLAAYLEQMQDLLHNTGCEYEQSNTVKYQL